MGHIAGRIDPDRLSDLIGAIYDCAVAPDAWDTTLDDVRNLLDCVNCVLSVADMPSGLVRALKTVGIEEPWLSRMMEFGDEIVTVYRSVPDMMTRPLDDPFTLSGDVCRTVLEANRYYREWAVPQGIEDCMQIFLMRDRHRNAALALGRHRASGDFGRSETELMRLLAPHFRRAVAIADTIDMRDLKAAMLGLTLDALATAVVIVEGDGRIAHANTAARRMMRQGDPILSRRGRLGARCRQASGRLKHALALAARAETGLADHGICMPLASNSGRPSVAHVLPLARGERRRSLVPRASAAVFVSPGDMQGSVSVKPLTDAWKLTPAEGRLLACLLRGLTLSQTAAELRIARTTAKTHLGHLMAKSGTRRQIDLLALAARLMPVLAAREAEEPVNPGGATRR